MLSALNRLSLHRTHCIPLVLCVGPVAVKLNGRREVSGVLRGFDQFMNLVVDDAQEVTNDKGDKQPIGQVVSSTRSTVDAILHCTALHSLTVALTDCSLCDTGMRAVCCVQVIRGNSILMIEALERV